MLALLLQLHIAGSLAFIGFVLVALYQLVSKRGNKNTMRKTAFGIGVYQVITGFMLAFLSPSVTIMAVCVRGLVLVGVLYVMSIALSRRLPEVSST